MKLKVVLLIFIICLLPQGLILPASAADNKPKLVLQITIDQMRGDFPMRYKDQLGEGGLDKKGETHERVYDVAVTDGRKIGSDGRCKTPVGSNR